MLTSSVVAVRCCAERRRDCYITSAALDSRLTTLSKSLLDNSSSEVRLNALASAAKASSVGAKTVIADVVESSKFTRPAACIQSFTLGHMSSGTSACSGGDWRFHYLNGSC